MADGQTALAFDFGGGTLDLSVVESRAGELALRATHGVPIGGDEIDRRIYRAKIFPELGEGALVHRPILDEWREETFPFEHFGDRLLNWALAYDLNRPDLLELLAQGVREGGDAGRRLERLHSAVKGNFSYAIFQAIERAKVALADAANAEIVVEDLDVRVPLSGDDLARFPGRVVEHDPFTSIAAGLAITSRRAAAAR